MGLRECIARVGLSIMVITGGVTLVGGTYIVGTELMDAIETQRRKRLGRSPRGE